MVEMAFPATSFNWLEVSDYEMFENIVQVRRKWQNFNSLVNRRFSSSDSDITEAMYHGSIVILALAGYESFLTAKNPGSFKSWWSNPKTVKTLAYLCFAKEALIEQEGGDSETIFDVFDINVTIDIFVKIMEFAYWLSEINQLDNEENFRKYCAEIGSGDGRTISLFLLEDETA